jgi:hypothetical protein
VYNEGVLGIVCLKGLPCSGYIVLRTKIVVYECKNYLCHPTRAFFLRTCSNSILRRRAFSTDIRRCYWNPRSALFESQLVDDRKRSKMRKALSGILTTKKESMAAIQRSMITAIAFFSYLKYSKDCGLIKNRSEYF